MEFHPQFAQDLRDAFRWYEEQQPHLGEVFLRALESLIQSLDTFPERFPLAAPNVRQAPMRRFPYMLYYRTDRNVLYLYACYHFKRQNDEWQDRL